MNLKLLLAIAALAATPGLALAQQGRPTPNAPKPTKADVQRVVQTISGDKAKTQTYCELGKLNDQIAVLKICTRAVEELLPKSTIRD